VGEEEVPRLAQEPVKSWREIRARSFSVAVRGLGGEDARLLRRWGAEGGGGAALPNAVRCLGAVESFRFAPREPKRPPLVGGGGGFVGEGAAPKRPPVDEDALPKPAVDELPKRLPVGAAGGAPNAVF